MHNEAVASGPVALPDPHEAELVARARERSAEAWDELYSRHYTQVYRYIHARVFDASTAEDLAATVFMAAVKGISSYRYHGQPFLAWLYRIARNVVSSHQRTMFRQRTVRLSAILELPGRFLGERSARPAMGGTEDPGTAVERMDLKEAILKLPNTQREVLLLKFFVGLDAREIGQIVGKDQGAVYSLQARALGSLKKQLR